MNGRCANSRLSQRKGSPHKPVPNPCPNRFVRARSVPIWQFSTTVFSMSVVLKW